MRANERKFPLPCPAPNFRNRNLEFFLVNPNRYCDLLQNMKPKTAATKHFLSALAFGTALILNSARAADSPEVRTPPASHTPHINGAGIFGGRPENPFFYHI